MVHMYICICVYMYVYIYMYMHIKYLYICVLYTYISMCALMLTCLYINSDSIDKFTKYLAGRSLKFTAIHRWPSAADPVDMWQEADVHAAWPSNGFV